MKKLLFAFLSGCLWLTACQCIEEAAPVVQDPVISAQIEQNQQTKTVLGDDNNVLWSKSDQIVAYMKSTYGHKYQIKPSFAGKAYADFTRISSAAGDDISAGFEMDHNVAYYPYSESVECVKVAEGYAVSVNIPSEQLYVPGSFANGSFPMIAVSEDNNMIFKNVCGGMKFSLKGNHKVTSIKIQGKNDEKLSGPATVTAYADQANPSIVMSPDASNTVTLKCGEGVMLNEDIATEFIIVMPPTSFTEGFSVTVTYSGGKTSVFETAKLNEVYRSSLLVMPEETDVFEEEVVNIMPGQIAATFVELQTTMTGEYVCAYYWWGTKDDSYLDEITPEKLKDEGWGVLNKQAGVPFSEIQYALSADTDYVVAYVGRKKTGELTDVFYTEFRTKPLIMDTPESCLVDIDMYFTDVESDSFVLNIKYPENMQFVYRFQFVYPLYGDESKIPHYVDDADNRDKWMAFFYGESGKGAMWEYLNYWCSVPSGYESIRLHGFVPDVGCVLAYCAEDVNGVVGPVKFASTNPEF